MKTELKDVGLYLEKLIEKNNPNKKERQNIAQRCKEKYNLPMGMVSSILAFSKPLEELDSGAFVAYCVLDCMNEKYGGVKFDTYFSDAEIKAFSSSKYEEEKVVFPIIIPSIEVSEDQWIGAIDAKTLIAFGKSGLIHYDKDTQRTLRKVVRGEKVFYKIALDKTALQEIKDLYVRGNYIPNTITLNIPEGKGMFSYDNDKRELNILQIDSFNITDGYHRYRALLQAISDDPEFNCRMELRITNFSVDKADSFIWQEDKKTKMRKIDSDSYNMNELSNRITQKVNTSSESNVAGLIARSGGNINFGEFSSCVKYFLLKGVKYSNQAVALLVVSKEVIKFFNAITEADPETFLQALHFRDIALLFYLMKTKNYEEIPAMYHKVKPVLDDKAKSDRKWGNKEMRRVLEKSIEESFNEVEDK